MKMYADDLSHGYLHDLAGDGDFAAHDAVDRIDADICSPSLEA